MINFGAKQDKMRHSEIKIDTGDYRDQLLNNQFRNRPKLIDKLNVAQLKKE